MGNVNFVRGLKGVRAAYPLAFSPSGVKDPTTGLAIPSTTCIFGAGYDATYREVMGAAFTHGISMYLTNTYTGASDAYGIYFDMDSTGINTASKYALGAHGIFTSGTGTEIWGARVCGHLSGGTVSGQWGAATLEAVVDSGVVNQPSGGVLQLVSWNNGGGASDTFGFLNLREYGSAKCRLFLYSPDLTVSNQSATAIFSSVKTAATNWSHAFKINVAGTNYWIMCTTTTPAA